MKKHLIGLGVAALVFGVIGEASATAFGSGNLSLTAGVEYTSDALNMNYGLETWTVGGIFNPSWAAHSSNPMYGNPETAGWEKAPDPTSLSYLDASVQISNDHSDPLKPKAESSVHISTVGTPSEQIQSVAQVMYFADFEATKNGNFEFFVDYSGLWEGSTTSAEDYVNLGGDLQARMVQKIFNDTGGYDWSDNLAYSAVRVSDTFKDGDSGSIDDFAGRLSLSFAFVEGGVYNFRFDSNNWAKGYSEDLSSPVPEPTTMLLFGVGLAGLAGVSRRKKK